MAKVKSDVKPLSIFTILSYIDKKRPWEELTEEEKKLWVVFLANKVLSMNPGFTELIADLQQYTIGVLTPRDTYKLYCDMLPKNGFHKYIKSAKSEKYTDTLVELISKHFLVNKQDAIDYIDLFFHSNLDALKSIVKKYGYSNKEVDKIIVKK